MMDVSVPGVVGSASLLVLMSVVSPWISNLSFKSLTPQWVMCSVEGPRNMEDLSPRPVLLP